MAGLAGVSRQSYGAIESGRSVPSTEVALRLSRGLGLGVEELFSLSDAPSEDVSVEMIGPTCFISGPVRLFQIGGRLLGMSLQGSQAPTPQLADGIGIASPAGGARVQLFKDRNPRPDLVAMGCDPAFELVARSLRRQAEVEVVWLRCGSKAALEGLSQGYAHVAGVHLMDMQTGRYNEAWVRRLVPFPCTRVRFARWEQCLVLEAGNPLAVEGVQDLAQRGARFVNREVGSGSRALIDMRLESAGVSGDMIQGYSDTSASGHFAVAEAVAAGLADAGVAVRAAVLAYGLTGLLLAEEMYELVIPDHFLEHPPVQELLTLLRTRGLRAQVEALGGYDGEGMGTPQ
jgi:molybdate-binding protein/DNA-binding XRE family transcriptional regulator